MLLLVATHAAHCLVATWGTITEHRHPRTGRNVSGAETIPALTRLPGDTRVAPADATTHSTYCPRNYGTGFHYFTGADYPARLH